MRDEAPRNCCYDSMCYLIEACKPSTTSPTSLSHDYHPTLSLPHIARDSSFQIELTFVAKRTTAKNTKLKTQEME